MANKKISDLPSAAAITGTEVIELVQGGVSVKEDIDTIGEYITDALQTEVDGISTTVSGLSTQIADKENKFTTRAATTAIQFTQNAIIGTTAAPVSGNLTFTSAGQVVGTVVIIIHQQGTVPTLGAEFVRRSDSASYDNTKINYIECRLIPNNIVHYKIYTL